MDFTGVALGAGVNQYMKMDEMARQNKKLEIEKAMADQQMEKGRVELDELRAVDGLRKKYQTINQAYARGEFDNPEVQGFFNDYNAQKGAWNNGYTMGYGTDAKGGRTLNFMDKDGKVVDSQSLDPQNFQRMMRDGYMNDLSYISPRYSLAAAQLGMEDKKIGVMEKHYDRPTYMQDGTGRIVGIDQNGQQVGTYGSARPVIGGSQNHFVPLTGGYSYNQTTGGFHAPDGSRVTDPATLEKITKMGTPGKATGDGMKHVGGNIYSQNGQTYAWNELDGTFKPANLPGQQPSLAMEDPRKPAQGTGLKTPEPKVSAQQQAADFATKFQGYSRQKAGNDYIVVGPRGERMWANDFDSQYGANSSLMLPYR